MYLLYRQRLANPQLQGKNSSFTWTFTSLANILSWRQMSSKISLKTMHSCKLRFCQQTQPTQNSGPHKHMHTMRCAPSYLGLKNSWWSARTQSAGSAPTFSLFSLCSLHECYAWKCQGAERWKECYSQPRGENKEHTKSKRIVHLFSFYSVLGIELKVLCRWSKHLTSELHPQHHAGTALRCFYTMCTI